MTGGYNSFRDSFDRQLASTKETARLEAEARRSLASQGEIAKALYYRAIDEAAMVLRQAGLKPSTAVHRTDGFLGRRNRRYRGWMIYYGVWVPTDANRGDKTYPRGRFNFNPTSWRVTAEGQLECELSGMDERENWESFDSFLAGLVARYVTHPESRSYPLY